MQNCTLVPGTGTNAIPSVLTKALAGIGFFVVALGSPSAGSSFLGSVWVSGCFGVTLSLHPAMIIDAIKRRERCFTSKNRASVIFEKQDAMLKSRENATRMGC